MNVKIVLSLLTLSASAWVSGQAAKPPKQLHLTLRRQVLVKGPEGNKTWEVVNSEVTWNPRETVLILVDVWNTHWCPTWARYAARMVPRQNEVLHALRDMGVQIVHSPTAPAMAPYYNHPGFRWMKTFPYVPMPPATSLKLPPQPLTVSMPDEGCDAWERYDRFHPGFHPAENEYSQAPGIDIVFEENGVKDGISEIAQDIWNMMQAKGIKNVIGMGQAANMCLLGREPGMYTWLGRGINTVVVGDLTEAAYTPIDPPYVTHEEATRLMVEYIEKFLCPTVNSEGVLK